jgi:tight adherence protein B
MVAAMWTHVSMQVLAIAFLVAVSIGGVAWVFLYPILSGERHAEKRMVSVARPEPPTRKAAARVSRSRREQVELSLKELETRNKRAKRPALQVRIAQAGLAWSKERFLVTAGVFGLAIFAAVVLVAGDPALAAVFGFSAAAGLPMWALKYLKKRRETRFLEVFPDSVDIIVRGIKAGLPLLDSMKVIVADAPEPVRSEFRSIIETQAIGIPLGEACLKLHERTPVPEANFFGIVIAIQQKSGGNLSEALGNLSRVLRDRKKMKAKINAMSMEAKASAGIIGALPLAVMLLVYLSSPAYIALLWTEPLGRIMLAASAVWMFVGVMVMKKMINFDF